MCRFQGFCINYIDVILIFSPTFEQHLNHLESLLSAICQENFRLKFITRSFAKNEVKYLRHIMVNNTIRPLLDNLTSIQYFPLPNTKKKIRQFLRKINFYHKYMENSAKLLEPPHNVLRKNIKFDWFVNCQEGFDKVKNILCS